MGLGMELDFEKYCKVGRPPKHTLPPPRHHSKSERNTSKQDKRSSRNGLSVLEEEEECLTELKLRNYRSVSCKDLPTREVDAETRDKVLRRGSVYESSRDRRRSKGVEAGGGGGRRKKIEFSLGNSSPFSFSILDSICGLDEEAESLEHECSSVMSLTSSSMFSSKASRGTSSQEFMNLSDRESSLAKCAERDVMENPMYKSDQVIGPPNNANVLKERDSVALQKSLYAKLELPHSPTRPNSNRSKGSSSSPRSRFTPIRKMFDPLKKSKSNRSPLSSKTVDRSDPTSAEPTNGCRNNKTFRKSLLHDFSSATQSSESGCQAVKKDDQRHHHHHRRKQKEVSPPCSPAHLRGDLKFEHKHGVPYFEFSFSHTEDVFVAKTWKAEDTLTRVYTFHSVRGRKRSNANGWGMKYSNKDSPMVGQMQVSTHLCSEMRHGGAFSNSMVTEFVLYDIAHARKSCAAEEETGTPSDSIQVHNASTNKSLVKETLEFDDFFDPIELRAPVTRALEHGNLDFSSPYPLAPADLHPSLEIAAVVIQVPLEKRESLKYKTGDKIRNQIHTDLPDASSGLEQQTKKSSADSNCRAKVNVVTPEGNHGLPAAESRGPSPLLDRWRLGGGCDCGGWDMACPLVVFGTRGVQLEEDVSPLEKDRPLELHVQGTKDNSTPALSIAFTEKGQCAVYFHAQLSSVQAFAICVAVLHATDASLTTEQEKRKHLLQCSSTKVLVEDEVEQLIESVTEEERRRAALKTAEGNTPSIMVKERRRAALKTAEGNTPSIMVKERRKAAAKTPEENPPSFVVNPPFSPIARV